MKLPTQWQSFLKLQVDADVILNYAWGYDIEYYFLSKSGFLTKDFFSSNTCGIQVSFSSTGSIKTAGTAQPFFPPSPVGNFAFGATLKRFWFRRPTFQESGIPNSGMWNPESWALESGIQLKESRIPLTIGIQNLSPLKSSSWNTQSTAWNPESKTALDSSSTPFSRNIGLSVINNWCQIDAFDTCDSWIHNTLTILWCFIINKRTDDKKRASICFLQ